MAPYRLLYPLDLVYRRAGIDPPRARAVAAQEIPPPYRSLLVHDDDMTITLEGQLEAFDAGLREKVLQNEVPLGRILRDGCFDCRSVPKAFLEIRPNPEIMGLFWMREPRLLYGRRTEMIREGRRVGDIVEVLPPVIR